MGSAEYRFHCSTPLVCLRSFSRNRDSSRISSMIHKVKFPRLRKPEKLVKHEKIYFLNDETTNIRTLFTMALYKSFIVICLLNRRLSLM